MKINSNFLFIFFIMFFSSCGFQLPQAVDRQLGKCIMDFQVRGLQAKGYTVWTEEAEDKPPSFELVKSVADHLASTYYSDFPHPIELVMVNFKGLMAATTGGGYLIVSEGLFSYLEDEAELAGVLGHEIGHMKYKHVLKNMESIPLGKILELAPDVVCKVLETINPLKTFKDPSKILPPSYFEKVRSFETQADEESLLALFNSVYDVYGLIRFFEPLVPLEKQAIEIYKEECPHKRSLWDPIYFAHPRSDERIAHLEDMLNSLNSNSNTRAPFGDLFYFSSPTCVEEDLLCFPEILAIADPVKNPDHFFVRTGIDVCGDPITEDSSSQKRSEHERPENWETLPIPLPGPEEFPISN